MFRRLDRVHYTLALGITLLTLYVLQKPSEKQSDLEVNIYDSDRQNSNSSLKDFVTYDEKVPLLWVCMNDN